MWKTRPVLRFAVALLLGASSLGAMQGAPLYEPQTLENPLGLPAVPEALNDAGEGIGSFFNSTSSYFDGVVWDSSGLATTLSSLHGFIEASPIGIRNDGTIVGSGSLDAALVSRAVILNGAGVTTLPSLAGDLGVVSAAFDMNDAGTVVGRSALIASPFWLSVTNVAVMWEGGVPTSLGSLGGFFAQAHAINGNKTVIGSSNTLESDFARGFVWDPILGMREVTPAEPGGFGQVGDINDQGLICGSATVGGIPRPCVWSDPDLPPLLLPLVAGDLSGIATAINETGSMVGASTLASGATRARLWMNDSVYDLGSLATTPLPFPLAGAIDVNEGGQVLATGAFTPELGFVNVVLTPLPPGPTLTASPATLSVAAGGTQGFHLNGGAALASALYLLLGSASGAEPGIVVAGHVLALNPDPYFQFTANHPNTPPLHDSLGTLDGSGTGQATFQLPPGLVALTGLQLHHAFGLADPTTGAVLGTSNSVPLALTP